MREHRVTDEQELLPCPFCGKEPISYPFRFGDGLTIECVNVDCYVRPHISAIPPQVARERWNIRAAMESMEPSEAMTLRLLVRKYVDPFDVEPGDHALVLAIGTDDEASYKAMLSTPKGGPSEPRRSTGSRRTHWCRPVASRSDVVTAIACGLPAAPPTWPEGAESCPGCGGAGFTL